MVVKKRQELKYEMAFRVNSTTVVSYVRMKETLSYLHMRKFTSMSKTYEATIVKKILKQVM